MASESNEVGRSESRTEREMQEWIEAQPGISRGSGSIIRMARKPKPKEFRQTVIICGVGLLILGFIGFVLLVLMENTVPWFFNGLMGKGW